MKKIFTLFLIALTFLPVSAQDVTVPETQLSLLTKVTADWCPLCGGWGWTLFEDLIDDNSDKAVLLAAHYSGGLENPTSTAYTGNLTFFGQPVFFLGTQNQGASSSNGTTVRNAVRTKVNQNYEQSPLAQTGLLVYFDEDTRELTAQTRTRFFEDTQGEFYLAIYLVERSYIGYQASQGNNANHKLLLREAFTQDPFGPTLANGAVAAGEEVDHTASLELSDAYDPGNLQIATVIWQKVDDTYEFVNANFTNEINQTTATSTVAIANINLLVGPNPSTNQTQVSLQLAAPVSRLEVTLLSTEGKPLLQVHRGALPAGEHRFDLKKPAAAGIYLLRVRNGGQVLTRSLIFQ